MAQKLLVPSDWSRKGSALLIAVKMLQHFHRVEPVVYFGIKHGVFLGYNRIPPDLSPNTRCNILMGGGPMKHDGLIVGLNWKRIRWVVFNSIFLQRIATSQFKNIGQNKILHILGGVCSDKNLFDYEETARTIDGNIRFVICAKWWKRPFKRKEQYIKLFNDYILSEFPEAEMYVLGNHENKVDGKVHFIYRDFTTDLYPSIYRRSHIHLMLSPFDTGPLTLTEALHYRIPFVCSNNCCGFELIERVDGKCGEIVKMDPSIKSNRDCEKYKPFSSCKFFNHFDYKLAMKGIRKVVSNYTEYTNWKWTNTFNYKNQADEWMELLYG